MMPQRIWITNRFRRPAMAGLGGSALVTFAIALWAAPGPAATDSTALTLEEAIHLAIANNPESRASRARVDAAEGRAIQASVWSNPELELTAEDWQVSGESQGFGNAKQLIGVTQTVPFPGKKKLDRKIGVSGVRLSEAELDLRRRELVRDVKAGFYQVLAVERLLEVQRELVNLAQSSATAARQRVEAGAAADQEQLRAEIPFERARSDLVGLQRNFATARQDLAVLLGQPELRVPLAGRLAETPDSPLLKEEPAQWLPRHPALRSARRTRQRAELELRRARLEPYPDVRFGVAGGRQDESGNAVVEFRASLPLPLLDRSKGRKKEAQAVVALAEAEETAVEQRLLRQWRTAQNRLRAAADQTATARERILPKANEALRLVQTGFEEGKFGFIDLLDTLRTVAEARLAYQQKLLELNLAQADLEALAVPTEEEPLPTTRPQNQ